MTLRKQTIVNMSLLLGAAMMAIALQMLVGVPDYAVAAAGI